MRFLADENFPRRPIELLRERGHDVLWAGKDFEATRDTAILERAESEGRLLLTLDRDFWQLAMQRPKGLERSGVVLVRIHPAASAKVETMTLRVLECAAELAGKIALVTRHGIDIVPVGRKAG